jgi:hypothetical protein
MPEVRDFNGNFSQECQYEIEMKCCLLMKHQNTNLTAQVNRVYYHSRQLCQYPVEMVGHIVHSMTYFLLVYSCLASYFNFKLSWLFNLSKLDPCENDFVFTWNQLIKVPTIFGRLPLNHSVYGLVPVFHSVSPQARAHTRTTLSKYIFVLH